MVLVIWRAIEVIRGKDIKRFLHKDSSGVLLSINNNKPIILVIPTFGKRRFVIEKISHFEQLFQDKRIADTIDKVYIVFSKPDPKVLNELSKILEGVSIRSKVTLLVEERRRGKAAAINLAIKSAETELSEKPRIVIVNDDDAYFSKDDILSLLESFKDEDVCAACIYPKYHSNVLNALYSYKRFIHRLEARLCNPATIGGELMAFRTIIELDEHTLSEDLQTNIACTAKGYKVKLIQGNVTEKYPSTLRGIANRTERTILGTYIEYKRFLKLRGKTSTRVCKYIFSAYLTSLLTMPIALMVIPIQMILLIFVISELILSLSIQLILAMLLTFIIILTIKKIRLKIIDISRLYFGLLYGSLRALVKVVNLNRYNTSSIEFIVSLWNETKV